MSHIAVDLKVIEVHAPMVARTMGEAVATTLGGLNLLWHRCWSTQQANITRIGIGGIFGMEQLDLRIEAMVDAGFLEAVADGWRVRGAEKYLRIREGNSKGGHAAKSNLIPGARQRRGEPSRSREGAEREPRDTLGSDSALTPSTEHRAPSTEHRKEEAAPPQPPVAAFEIVPPDFEKIESWQKEDFWRAAEITRRSRGYPPQKWPNSVSLSRWWSEARGMADVMTLAQAFTRFADDPHWTSRNPPAPFAGFMTQWNSFLPRSA